MTYSSPNFYTSAQCVQHYGRPRTIEGITIHWWGDPAFNPKFDSVVATLCTPGIGKSAHYVVEAGRHVQIVDDANAAWHAGNGVGNATTIGLELNPLARDGDYQEAANLIRELRAKYGDLPLWPHKHWFATACPGVYDLGRLDTLARTETATREDDMVLMIAWLADGRQYVGDGITRRWLSSQQSRDDLVYQAGVQGITVKVVGKVDRIDWLGLDITPAAPAPAPAASVDMTAVQTAAEAGARTALTGLTLKSA